MARRTIEFICARQSRVYLSVAALAALVVLVIQTLWIVEAADDDQRRLMGVLRVGIRFSVSYPIDNYIVHNRDGEPIVHTSYDGIDADAYDESPAVMIDVSTIYRRHGLWARTSRHIERWFRETPIGAVTPEQRTAWRAAWAEYVTRRGFEPDAQRFLSQNSFVRIEHVWSGYLHNALTLALLAVLLAYGLMVSRCVRSAKRAAAGRCPSCDYNLCGAVSDRCPECGHVRTDMCGDMR